jgi:hypothetical protein
MTGEVEFGSTDAFVIDPHLGAAALVRLRQRPAVIAEPAAFGTVTASTRLVVTAG